MAADLVFYGLHLAGKTPVMMNWTTGPANLAHGIRATEVKQVISSSRLVDRLGLEIEGADYLFLEEVKKTIGKAEAVSTMLTSRLRPGSLLRSLPRQRGADPAVFLFTSGSGCRTARLASILASRLRWVSG
ncbi:MAG: hypothetical protein EBZ13_11185, partial [Planctomycetia bacterium]|nr:hypothetical protein [Planctomycetia bacterium]